MVELLKPSSLGFVRDYNIELLYINDYLQMIKEFKVVQNEVQGIESTPIYAHIKVGIFLPSRYVIN